MNPAPSNLLDTRRLPVQHARLVARLKVRGFLTDYEKAQLWTIEKQLNAEAMKKNVTPDWQARNLELAASGRLVTNRTYLASFDSVRPIYNQPKPGYNPTTKGGNQLSRFFAEYGAADLSKLPADEWEDVSAFIADHAHHLKQTEAGRWVLASATNELVRRAQLPATATVVAFNSTDYLEECRLESNRVA